MFSSQHCFICRPLDSTMSEDAPTTRLDLIHRLPILYVAYFIGSSLFVISVVERNFYSGSDFEKVPNPDPDPGHI